LVTDGLRILGVLLGFEDFTTHFLNEDLFQDMAHINDIPLLGDIEVVLGILSSCVACRPFYFKWITPLSSFVYFLVSFDMKVMQVCGDIMGPRW
jgi:hypothetical protein